MPDFQTIPLRSNDEYNAIRAEWFNTIRSKLASFEIAPDFPEYANEAAFVAAKGTAAAESDYFWDTTEKTLKVYNGTEWGGIGGGSGYAIQATQDIAADGQITLTNGFQQLLKVQGDLGSQTANIDLFTTAPLDGTTIVLEGKSNANTLTVQESDTAGGCLINGNCILRLNSTLTLVYDETDDRFKEIARKE